MTGNQIADLAGVVSNSQWLKYISVESPRAVSLHILFCMAAQLSLSEDELSRVVKKMHDIGAETK